ncbi:MAG: hypothetical protein M3Z22_08130 [Verrucomicrobiota bacterium]|nr:hypothetical protein [Verrucomicrobiota bacterium]
MGARCQEIHDLAAANEGALNDYNGDIATDIHALQDAIAAFTPLVGQSRIATGVKKKATSDIAALEESADALLKNELDRSMRKQKTKNAQFFAEYTSARMIIDLGVHHEKPPTPPTPPATPHP